MEVKTPNRILYFLTYIITYPLLKICFRLKVNRDKFSLPKGACVVLANHSTLPDFLIVMLSLYPRRINAVTARKFFLYSPLHKLLPMAGCIPKNMFDPDVRSVIGIKTVLKRGGKIILFPEGRCSSGHAYTGIHKSTGKLLKNLAVPVVSSFVDGAVNCMPLWRRGIRFGRVQVTHRNLFSTDDLKEMSADEINEAIDARLSGREGKILPAKPIETLRAKRLAEGLHKLLYYCVSCGREFTTETENNTIRCTACGFSANLDRRGGFDGNDMVANISQWYDMQMEYEAGLLSSDMQPVTFSVKLKIPSSKPGGGMADYGSGMMSIDPSGWQYDGEYNGEPVNMAFPVDAVPAISYDYNSNIQIFFEGKYYMFIPEELHKCLKYAIIAESLHKKFASKPLLTSGK